MLEKIIRHKFEEVKNMKLVSYERSRPLFSVSKHLSRSPFICEIKRASPSLGQINSEQNITLRAKLYELFGAGAISVLTDETFFQGSYKDLFNVGKCVEIPILCKDFIISEIQIENAYRSGADFILLITSILSESELKKLTAIARSLGMEILYELHDYSDFDKISKLDPKLVGVNARDFQTLEVDIRKSAKIISHLKGSFIKVAESGIKSGHDVSYLKKMGAEAFLIGTTLMLTENLEEKFRELQNGNQIREGECS